MCLLGRKESSNEAEANYDQPGGILRDGQPADDLFARNLHALLDADPKHPNAEKRQQQLTTALKSNGDGNFIGNDDGGAKGPGNLSGIMHAARGGWKTFDLACGLITTNEDESSSISLSNVLGLSTELEQFDDTRTQLWVQLLAQAVLGGDVLVLKKMYLMIGGGPGNTSKRNQSVLASLAKKTDYILTVTELLQAVRRGRRDDAGNDGCMVGELAVVDALEDPSEDGGRLKASLFVLAVLSGKTAAVRWAAAFVFDNIEDKQVAWDILCGKGFPVSPLAYATSTSFTRGLFLAVFDELEKRQPQNDEEVDTPLQAQFRSETKGQFTPLAGAVFCGTPRLVKDVIDEYKRQGLDRNEVEFGRHPEVAMVFLCSWQ